MKWDKIYGYLRYSGIKVSFILNPLQWYFKPYYYRGQVQEWPDDTARKLAVGLLFIYFVIYIDDGSW